MPNVIGQFVMGAIDHRRDTAGSRQRDFRQRQRRHQPGAGATGDGDSGQSHRHERQRVLVPLPNATNGIFIDGNGTTVGGTSAGAANIIANNGQVGVNVVNGAGNAVLGNSIFSNGNLGINLGPCGVTPNDAGDGDTGANNLQNFPVLAAAPAACRERSTARRTARSPSSYFGNTACDPSQNGEGETFLGSASVTTDANGNATLPLFTAAAGLIVTATATSSTNDTSEFSACVTVPLDAGDVHGH